MLIRSCAISFRMVWHSLLKKKIILLFPNYYVNFFHILLPNESRKSALQSDHYSATVQNMETGNYKARVRVRISKLITCKK